MAHFLKKNSSRCPELGEAFRLQIQKQASTVDGNLKRSNEGPNNEDLIKSLFFELKGINVPFMSFRKD